jgi:hypothetical protein
LPQFDPDIPAPPQAGIVPAALPVRLVGTGRLLPELGETNSSALKLAIDNLAVQVVSMMEKPWGLRTCPP